MVKHPLSRFMSCNFCPKRALELYASMVKGISPCKAMSFIKLLLYHILHTTLQNKQTAFSQYIKKKVQIKTISVKDSLQLRDAATFLKDCTQLLQVTGLKMTICQSRRGKRNPTVQVCMIANKIVNFTPSENQKINKEIIMK